MVASRLMRWSATEVGALLLTESTPHSKNARDECPNGKMLFANKRGPCFLHGKPNYCCTTFVACDATTCHLPSRFTHVSVKR